MFFINQVCRIGRDAEIKESKNGNRFMVFTAAINYYDGAQKTIWVDVTSFNETDMKRVKYFTKGSLIILHGDLTAKLDTGRDGKIYLNFNARAASIEFINLGGKKDNNDTSNNRSNSNSQDYTPTTDSKAQIPQDIVETEPVGVSSSPVSNSFNNDDDDLPF